MNVVSKKQSGVIRCKECFGITSAWRSSGMSDCCPHFYCDTCSNVILREADRALIYSNKPSQALVDQIAETLPHCSCGGQFLPDSNPKCSICNRAMVNSWDAVKRLGDPNMILIPGACVFGDEKPPYRVEITGFNSLYLRIRNSSLARFLARLFSKIGFK